MNLTSTEAAATSTRSARSSRMLPIGSCSSCCRSPRSGSPAIDWPATNVGWGAQDVHPDDAGAHTGDVSAPMLADLGCTYVEVGHYERRRDHGETDELVAAKIAAVQRWGMTAIVCVGEQERLPFDARRRGHRPPSCGFSRDAIPRRSVVAYEPSWAIGVGAHPAVARAGSTSPSTRSAGRSRRGRRMRRSSRSSTAAASAWTPRPALLAQPAVDGLFVGRQALDPRVFAAIAHVEPAATRPSTVP